MTTSQNCTKVKKEKSNDMTRPVENKVYTPSEMTQPGKRNQT